MKLGRHGRRALAGGLVLALLGTGLFAAPASAEVSHDLDLDTGAGYLQTMADMVKQIYCQEKNQGYFDPLNSQQILNDVMSGALSAAGPLGTVLQMTEDASDFLGNTAVTSWLNAGETQLDNEINAFDQGNGFGSLPPNQLNNFENYVENIDFTTSQGAAIADAALAAYGTVYKGVPPDGIAAYVADHRGMVNSNYAALQDGLKVMLLQHLQGEPTTWKSPSLSQFVMQMLGDKFGSVSLANWLWEQVMNADCSDSVTPPVHASLDPNSISVTPLGGGSGGWVPAAQRLVYTIRFENQPTATAPAVDVRVVATLDAGLDPASVQGGSSSFSGTEFSFDQSSRRLVWTLPAIDLPPDTSPPNGEGWVSFSASPAAGLANGATISESANVYFDYNPPVQTNAVSVKVDSTAPAAAVSSVTTGATAGTLHVSWQGTSQAGIARYQVYESIDGGSLRLFTSTDQTSTVVAASAGHTYGFAAQATDVAGLSSTQPAAPQVTYAMTGPSGAAPAATGGAAATVGASGGLLASSDGAFKMTVPAGGLGPGASLTVQTSTQAPAGLPPLPTGLSPASPFVTLTGSTLSVPAVATLKYTAAAGQNVTVFADGAWHYLPTRVVGDGTVQVGVTGPETLVVAAASMHFSDVPAGYWARGDIAQLVAPGIISGFPDGTFRPAATLTRAQFVKMLDVTLNLAPAGGTSAFRDVAPAAWYAPYVATAVHARLVQGTSPTTFSPDGTLTREQMALLLTRALKLSGSTPLTFADAARIDPWARSAVAAAVAAGFVRGLPDGTFQPQGSATRAQAAKVLALAVAHLAPSKVG